MDEIENDSAEPTSTADLIEQAMTPPAAPDPAPAAPPAPSAEPAPAASVPMLPEELKRLRILDQDFDVPDLATARRLMERGRIEELESPRRGRELKQLQDEMEQKRPILQWHEQYGDLLEDEVVQRILWARKNGLDPRSVFEDPQGLPTDGADPNDPLSRRIAGIENELRVRRHQDSQRSYEEARTTVATGYEKWRADHNRLGADGQPQPGHLSDEDISTLVSPYFEELLKDMKPGEITRPGKMELTLERAYRLARHDVSEHKLKEHGDAVARATIEAQQRNAEAAIAAARPSPDSGQGTVPATMDFKDIPPTRKGHRDMIGRIFDGLRGG